jgi:hypothetical protein
MMEERYHATTQNRFYPDMSNVNKNITVEAKLISPPTYFVFLFLGTFEKLRKATLRFVMSVRPRGTTGLPLDEFFLNF